VAELVDAEIDAVKETILNQPLVDAKSENLTEVFVVYSGKHFKSKGHNLYHTGSNPVLTTISYIKAKCDENIYIISI
jgi:hypothetical protein